VHQFASLAEAQAITEWARGLESAQPAHSLGHLTLNEFVGQRQVIQMVTELVSTFKNCFGMGPTSSLQSRSLFAFHCIANLAFPHHTTHLLPVIVGLR
jgi:hypothetical protein